jgi:hypothetical protein
MILVETLGAVTLAEAPVWVRARYSLATGELYAFPRAAVT